MKTVTISSSLREESKGKVMLKAVAEKLKVKGADVDFIDCREFELGHTFRTTDDMEKIKERIAKADNLVIGMSVYCYTVNDSLKSVLDNCFENVNHKLYGVVCAAGGQKSYLATQHLTQICMNEWRMLQLPRVVYGTGQDFSELSITNEDLLERIDNFANEFYDLGSKLLK